VEGAATRTRTTLIQLPGASFFLFFLLGGGVANKPRSVFGRRKVVMGISDTVTEPPKIICIIA
jgi:hypothetical protein